jgi:hypothetical protein
MLQFLKKKEFIKHKANILLVGISVPYTDKIFHNYLPDNLHSKSAQQELLSQPGLEQQSTE